MIEDSQRTNDEQLCKILVEKRSTLEDKILEKLAGLKKLCIEEGVSVKFYILNFNSTLSLNLGNYWCITFGNLF